MSLQVITAPAGSGKTQYVVDQIRQQRERQWLSRILVIFPSAAQREVFRARLGTFPGATFGITLTDFGSFYRDVLDAVGTLPLLIPEAGRYRVVRHVIRQIADANRLSYFRPIADKPGFITSICNLIADLKQGLVYPEEFAQLAATPRTRDLAAIYVAYQNFLLEHTLVDREGIGWLAHDALKSDRRLCSDFDYAAADGFDQFNPTQIALLALLAERLPHLDVTLTYQPKRLAHLRFARTLDKFPKTTHLSLSPTAPSRAMALEHLERCLFELDPPRVSAQDAIRLIAAPDRTREVRAIAREVKRLLVGGMRPEQIGVVFRRLDPYQSLAREVFTEFGIAFRVRSGVPLLSNPLIAAMINLLALSEDNFPWRDTLDALRSPYFVHQNLSDTDRAQIERITREAVVVRGRDAWCDAFIKSTAPLREDETDTRLVTQLSKDEIDALRSKIEALFARITPLRLATVRDFVQFIEELIGRDPVQEEWQRINFPDQLVEDTTSLRVIARARDADAELVARDVCALAEFKNLLRGLVQAAEILGEGEIAWSDLLVDLQEALDAATYDLAPMNDGRVVVSTVTQARGMPKDFVFLGGLVESEFPPRASEDSLMTSSERDELRARGIPLADLKSREETTLFYEAAALPRRRLYLSYPYLDEDANELFPSPYVESVKALFNDLVEQRVSLNQIPGIGDAASFNELAVSTTRGLMQGNAGATAANDVLCRESAAWRQSLLAREIEIRRQAPFYDEFSGILRDPALCSEFERMFDADYAWSASQFNEWGGCGFRFFAKRLLQLEEIADPEEGLNELQLGSLYHEILEQTYRQLASRKIIVTVETLADAQAILHEQATALLQVAHVRFAFRPTAWWAQERCEILRRLDGLLLAEAERNDTSPAQPLDFEVAFGFKHKPPLQLVLPIGTIRVRGKIDRMDRAMDGVVLIDYKSGSTKIGVEQVIQGRNVQLPIYWLAATAMGLQVSNAFFLHIRDGKTSGQIAVGRDHWLEAAQGHITSFVENTRAGAFAVQPKRIENGTCAARCEFVSLCRVGHWNAKPREQPE